MGPVIRVGTVEDIDGGHVQVSAHAKSRTVTVVVREESERSAATMEPFRVRRLIAVLTEALRHLED